jgi:hypothetical protein
MAIKVANNQSLTAITALPSAITGGAMTLLETQTASSSSTISFTSNIDSTYKEYVFKWINVHPSTEDSTHFTFQADTGTNTSYNQTITSTFIQIRNEEADTDTQLVYSTSGDQAQGTAFQQMFRSMEGDNDSSICGYLHLFDPASTTFIKHFYGEAFGQNQAPCAYTGKVAGYFNTTTAITRVQFKHSTGNIDAGTFKLYGVT